MAAQTVEEALRLGNVGIGSGVEVPSTVRDDADKREVPVFSAFLELGFNIHLHLCLLACDGDGSDAFSGTKT